VSIWPAGPSELHDGTTNLTHEDAEPPYLCCMTLVCLKGADVLPKALALFVVRRWQTSKRCSFSVRPLNGLG